MKTYQQLTLSLVTSLSLAIGFNACSSSGSSSSSSIGTAYYLDSAVAGIEYQCGNQNGFTKDDGSFNFEYGQNCAFTLGGIPLKTILSTNLVNNAKIVETNTTVAALLQSLDSDGDVTNGITIAPSVITYLEDNNYTTLPTDDTEISTLVGDISANVSDVNLTIVTIADAIQHLTDTQTAVTTELLANKAFYIIDNEANFYFKIQFDANVTSLAYTDLLSSNSSTDFDVTIAGTVIYINTEGLEVTSQTQEYLNMADYNVSGTPHTYRAYFDEAKAQEYYNSLYLLQNSTNNSVWAIDDGTNFQYLTLLSDGTFSYAEYDSTYSEPENGLETGTYTIASDGSSITFTVLYDGNYIEDVNGNYVASDVSGVGSLGTPATYPISISADGTQLTVTLPDGTSVVFNNVTEHMDVWKSSDALDPNFQYLGLDTTGNRFIFAEYDSTLNEPENGLEAGTYSIATDGSSITFNLEYDGNYIEDANGDYNATDISGVGSIGTAATYPISLSTDGNTLTVTVDTTTTVTFTKLF